MIETYIDWALDRDIDNSNDKLVLIVIARRCNKHWAAFPGKAEIARKTGLAEPSVVKCVRRLERGGHLARIAFAGINGQDQKIGYVLAGCGRPLNELDDAFLALAFANRKQPGVPQRAKPQHWSGEHKGEGGPAATLPGWPDSHPEGRQPATPRSKEPREDHKEQEEAFGEAAVPAANDHKQAAIAEVCAEAPTNDRDCRSSSESGIPAQRQKRDRRTPIQRRDDDWRAQIAAASHDHLQIALDEYTLNMDGVWEWALDAAGLDMGISPGMKRSGQEEEQFRAAYLWLLKKHADDDEHLDILLEPLDDSIASPEPEYDWIEYVFTPAGMTNEAFVEQIFQAIRAMPLKERGPQIAEMRQLKPGIWAQCRKKAKDQLRRQKLPVEMVAIDALAIQYGALHYRSGGKWPAVFVPPSLRSNFPSQSAPPAWAA